MNTTSNLSTPLYDLTGLRAQIIANGSILVPQPLTGTSTDPHGHLELVVVKREHGAAPRTTVTTTTASPTSNKLVGTSHTTTAGTKTLGATANTVKASDTKKVMSEAKGLWYATLLKRTGSANALRVVIKGEGQESVGRALEAVLEESGKRVDRLMRAYARDI